MACGSLCLEYFSNAEPLLCSLSFQCPPRLKRSLPRQAFVDMVSTIPPAHSLNHKLHNVEDLLVLFEAASSSA